MEGGSRLQDPVRLHHQHPKPHGTVTLGCNLALPHPSHPWGASPHHGAWHSSVRQQGPCVGNSQNQQPWKSPGHGGLPATGKRLTGVKPSEFGTAVRKSRPAREP